MSACAGLGLLVLVVGAVALWLLCGDGSRA